MALYSGSVCSVCVLERKRLGVLLENVCYSWQISECEISKGFSKVTLTSPHGTVELTRAEWNALGISTPSASKTIFLYLFAIAAACSLLVFGLRLLAAPIASRISLETEKRWFASSKPEDKDLMLLLQQLHAPAVIGASLDLSDTDVNAFALPGARIQVNQGLVCFTKSPEELLGVLSHEVGHIRQRHILRSVISRSGTFLLIVFMGAGSTAELANSAISNRFSVEDEAEADQISAELMAGAGFSPDAMAHFFERLSLKQGEAFSKLEFLLSDHPLTQSRIDFFKIQSAAMQTGRRPVSKVIDKAWLNLRSKADCKEKQDQGL